MIVRKALLCSFIRYLHAISFSLQVFFKITRSSMTVIMLFALQFIVL